MSGVEQYLKNVMTSFTIEFQVNARASGDMVASLLVMQLEMTVCCCGML